VITASRGMWDTQGIPSYMRASKRFNISKHIIERNVKNDDSIVKITHIHAHQKII